MKNVKAPTSNSYHAHLIKSLQNPEEAAGYLEAILEEQDPEPELLRRALTNLVEALSQNMTPLEQAELYQALDRLLSKSESSTIYEFGNWLNRLGLKLSIIPSDS